MNRGSVLSVALVVISQHIWYAIRTGGILTCYTVKGEDVQTLSSIQNLWETLARDDPMWAVLTWPKKRGRWESDEFFATGADEIRCVMDRIRRRQIDVPRRTALDFGCGVGRVTQALAFHFERVWGIDISPTMISEAERYNRFPRSCHYSLNCESDLRCFKSGSFDFVYSCITLQHLGQNLAISYLQEFVRLAAFGATGNTAQYLSGWDRQGSPAVPAATTARSNRSGEAPPIYRVGIGAAAR